MDLTRIMTLYQAEPESFEFTAPSISEDGQWAVLTVRVKVAALSQLGPEALASLQGLPQ